MVRGPCGWKMGGKSYRLQNAVAVAVVLFMGLSLFGFLFGPFFWTSAVEAAV